MVFVDNERTMPHFPSRL
ncbi:hypothetical protein VCCP1040_2035, partial [Vibrio cholerae CP1040(13)]